MITRDRVHGDITEPTNIVGTGGAGSRVFGISNMVMPHITIVETKESRVKKKAARLLAQSKKRVIKDYKFRPQVSNRPVAICKMRNK